MAMRLSENVKHAFDRGADIAKEMKSEFYVLEHLFLALCEDPEFIGVLQDYSVNVEEYKAELKAYIKDNLETSENEPFEKPDFIGEEVTGDPRYYNSHLMIHPYNQWH